VEVAGGVSTLQRKKKKSLLFWCVGSTRQSHTKTVCDLGHLSGWLSGLWLGKPLLFFSIFCFAFFNSNLIFNSVFWFEISN
jgi:hypothetical protein